MNRKAITNHTIIGILLLLFFLGRQARAQENPDLNTDTKVSLSAKHYGDSIVLRWAPMDAEWWYYGIQEGYSLYRRTVSDNNENYERIAENIMPWPVEKLESILVNDSTNQMLILPLQTIYRDWENSEYSSGGLSDMYEKSQFFEQRFQTTVLAADVYPQIASAAGLKFVDKNIDPDKIYSYRIAFNAGAQHRAYHVVRQWQIMDKPIIHEAIEKENSISLHWDKKLHGMHYTAYYIERSYDGVTFQRLNELPYVYGVAHDIPNKNYIIYTDKFDGEQQFYYRIIGIDPFGDESEASDPIFAASKDRTPPLVQMPFVTMSEDGRSNKIIWSHEPLEELKQVILYKKDYSAQPHIVYEATAAEGFASEIVDEQVRDGMTDYFLVLVDTAGNYAQSQRASLYRKDDVPPGPPQNLQAEIDSTGRIFLSWEQGPDRDVIAYYIYTADRKEDNFIKLNQEKYPYRIYQDSVSIDMHTPKRYYKVAAIDKGGNIGAFSEILEVARPDRIPPAPCLFYDYKIDTSGIFLGLLPSGSRDVKAYRLYRKAGGESAYRLHKTFDKKVPSIFLDEDVAPNTAYSYQWVAVDGQNQESSRENSTLHVRSYDTRIMYKPVLKIEEKEEGLHIRIANHIPGEDYRVQLIRSFKGGPYQTITTLTDSHEFWDNIDLDKPGPSVSYKARILYRDGKRSKFSDVYSK